MAENSAIEWTTHTFNPWWGCVKVSPACTNCYAATFAARFGTEWGPKARRKFFGEKHWNEPLKWNAKAAREGVRPRVFCASMADVFEAMPLDHPDALQMEAERHRLALLIQATPHLDWLLLTKRPENATRMLPEWRDSWPANAWAGATAEDQEQANRRVSRLLEIPAVVHFVSYEPACGPVDFTDIGGERVQHDALTGEYLSGREKKTTRRLDWIICGGESGQSARPMHPDWARAVRDACRLAGVAFFFKQWGEWAPGAAHPLRITRGPNTRHVAPVDGRDNCLAKNSACMVKVGKSTAGRMLDGRIHSAFPKATKRVLAEARV